MKGKAKRYIAAMAAVPMLFAAVAMPVGTIDISAYAAETYSNVLDDLQKDETFDMAQYPAVADDYSLSVEQIAESTDGELFVYTYQPCQITYPLVATEINMSLSESVDGTKLYGLTLLSSNGVLCKYKVIDFAVSSADIRYYNITSIYRKWLKGIDDETGNDNTQSAVAFSVGKLYTATTENGEIVYSCLNIPTIEILNPYAGYLRYIDGFGWHKEACDSHYVAFSTDKPIDALYEAELEYTSRLVEKFTWDAGGMPAITFGDPEEHHIVLTDDEEYRKDGKWWLFGESAEYSRIQTVKEFIDAEELSAGTIANLVGKEWVLRFTETDYTYQHYGWPSSTPGDSETYTRISDVTVLRLKYKYVGDVYNLGAVSGKVSEGPDPGNVRSPDDWWLWCLIAGGVLAVGLMGYVKYREREQLAAEISEQISKKQEDTGGKS